MILKSLRVFQFSFSIVNPTGDKKGDTMKNVHINSKIKLISMKQKIMDYLDIANQIPDDDFRIIVQTAQQHKKYIHNIQENAERGNIFLLLFWTRELIEYVLHSEE